MRKAERSLPCILYCLLLTAVSWAGGGCVGWLRQGDSTEGCRGGLSAKRTVLSHAGHRWFQLPSKDSPQHTTVLHSCVCGASGKTYLRKGKNCRQRSEERKRWETTLSQWWQKGRQCSRHRVDSPLQPVETPCWSRRRVWGGCSSREQLLQTGQKPHSPMSLRYLLRRGRGAGDERVKLSLWRGMGAWGMCHFNILIYFLPSRSILIGYKFIFPQ